MGLRRCGCPVAVVVVDTDYPASDVEKSKRDFLKQGYNVVYSDWGEWSDVYRPKFLRHCAHATEIGSGTQPSEAERADMTRRSAAHKAHVHVGDHASDHGASKTAKAKRTR